MKLFCRCGQQLVYICKACGRCILCCDCGGDPTIDGRFVAIESKPGLLAYRQYLLQTSK